ncbi:hypothetical protein ABW19_dt0200300 [Dactylella cylindrospora]|nr:hypothetical protein ABW19_dt0200300 [Dactylella cylindrospora]
MPSLKRKRTNASISSTDTSTATESSQSSRDAINAIFKRHFESKFGAVDLNPVSDSKSKNKGKKSLDRRKDLDSDSNDESDEDIHSNFSDKDEDEGLEDGSDEEYSSNDEESKPKAPPGPEIIEYDFSRRGPAPSTKPSRRSFMSSKPPTSTTTTSSHLPSQTHPSTQTKDDPTDLQNLKNDVALQTLLRESHLLDRSTLTHSSGKNRHKAIESRIQSLGGTPMTQLDGSTARIPMHIRKGMVRKKEMREEKRRRVAKENGVVLAKGDKKRKKEGRGKGGRDAGVGNPSVGKFRRGALVLSRKDVAGMKV